MRSTHGHSSSSLRSLPASSLPPRGVLPVPVASISRGDSGCRGAALTACAGDITRAAPLTSRRPHLLACTCGTAIAYRCSPFGTLCWHGRGERMEEQNASVAWCWQGHASPAQATNQRRSGIGQEAGSGLEWEV